MVPRLLVALALLAAAPVPSGPELLTNPGFEQPNPAGLAASWTRLAPKDWGRTDGRTERVTDVTHGGGAALLIAGVHGKLGVVSAAVPVSREQSYRLSGWLRTELVRGERAYLTASWSSPTRWLSNADSLALTGRQPWTQVELILPAGTRPAEATSVTVSFRVDGDSDTGRAWADDLSFTAVTLPPPPSRLAEERQRQLDLARAALVERAIWQDRVAVLQQRRADLEALLAATDAEARLAAGRWLPQRAPRPRAELEATVPEDEAAVRAALPKAVELPALREQARTELDRLLTLKRRLDEQPAARRLYLASQLAALRIAPCPAKPDEADAAAVAALRTLPPSEGSLNDLTARAAYAASPRLSLAITVPQADDRVVTGLYDAAGRVVRAGELAGDGTARRVEWRDLPVRGWSTDYPYLYRLRLVLLRAGKPVDGLEHTVGFRDLRVVESDVTPTMRHVDDWAATDYTCVANGQPWFPRGTVCGDLTSHPQETVALFEELWLDFQRTYGNALPQALGPLGDTLATHGLGLAAAFSPNYQGLTHYTSRREGLDAYRRLGAQLRAAVDQPAVLSVQVGNEAELDVWGANLGRIWGDDLQQGLGEVTAVAREVFDPAVPVGYVRAGGYRRVLPVPGEDYSGINQYTGRYGGSRRTIAGDLASLGWAATQEATPIAITEWNGPKYSWATSGVGGVDEEGAAAYLLDYWRELVRQPTMLTSTEFVLNWVVTPVEDLTTLPKAEGRKRRAAWTWSNQQGTPWYPHIFPGLLTDTPARRTMRGFQSPLYPLVETPGPLRVAYVPARRAEAERLAAALTRLGHAATAVPLPEAPDELDANLLVLGGTGGEQPPFVRWLEDRGVIGPTDASFPASGGFLVQPRIDPVYPDRYLVTVTAADDAGYSAAVAKLLSAADSLAEAYGRRASARRLLALIDDSPETRQVFDRYVCDLPTRGFFVARDDLRTRLDPAEIVGPGGLQAPFADLGLVLVTPHRALEPAERELLLHLPERGVEVVWSAATLAVDPGLAKALGVSLGAAHRMTEPLPVADWANRPLAVPDLGSVDLDAILKFGKFKPDAERLVQAMTINELTVDGAWQPAATAGGRPVVARKAGHWVFGADLASAARVLWTTTHQGVNHNLYDRDTANGLERLFRLVTNAGAGRREARGSDRPRLRAAVRLPAGTVAPDAALPVDVLVRDGDGPGEALVRVGVMPVAGESLEGSPDRWLPAERVGPGRYRATLAAAALPQAAPGSYRRMRRLAVFASVERPGAVGDWVSQVVRVGAESDEAARLADLTGRLARRRVRVPVEIVEREPYVQMHGGLELPEHLRADQPAPMVLSLRQIKGDQGNAWIRDFALTITPAGGAPIVMALEPGKLLTGAKTTVYRQRPNESVLVDAAHPWRAELAWPALPAGRYQVALRCRYTDEYRPAVTDLPRDDAVGEVDVEAAP